MEKTIYVGKLDGNSVSLNLRVEEKNKEAMTVDHRTVQSYKSLGISGSIRNGGGGQIQDTIRKGLDEYAIPKESFARIIQIWDEYHLNDLNAACEHQETFSANVDNWREWADKESEKCPHGYRYGSAWLIREIPDEVVEEVIQLFDGEEVIPEDKLVRELVSEDDEMRVYEIPSHNLIIKLIHIGEEYDKLGYYNQYKVSVEDTESGTKIDFDYSDSIHNSMNEGELHDELIRGILGCIKCDYYDTEEQYPTFDEFCSSFGYNSDSIKDEKLYHRVIEHARNLQTVFKEELVMTFPD